MSTPFKAPRPHPGENVGVWMERLLWDVEQWLDAREGLDARTKKAVETLPELRSTLSSIAIALQAQDRRIGGLEVLTSSLRRKSLE